MSPESTAAFFAGLQLPTGAQYCMVLGRLFKLHPDFDAVLFAVLHRNPATYVLVVREADFELNDLLFERWKTFQVNYSMSFVLDRIKFVNYLFYTTALVHDTVILDTFPYGGCLTTHDALSNGRPIVTLPGAHARGRFSYSMYRQMRHTNLVAQNATHYVDLVHRLLNDPVFLQNQQQQIEKKFVENIHMNREVAKEWIDFFLRLFDARD